MTMPNPPDDGPPQIPLALSYYIRVASRSDLRKLEWYGSQSHTRPYIEQAYKAMLAGRRIMIVADLNDFPVGQIYVQYDSKNKQHADGATRGYIYAFRVMDHLQRCGIGTQLLKSAERVLIERGYKLATLQVSKRNENARRLYQKNGYRVFNEDPGHWYYVDREGEQRELNDPTWVMEKRLVR
ncbi:MAG: GNAT family N-acetyltransferase [Chloroflexi bacterium]|nr:GNAT family N-acetyltransferase [Chloroflexota bacterium]